MDKAILKKFAIESRQDLIDKIRNKINTFYVDEDFKSEQRGDLYILFNDKHTLSLTNDEYKKRELLIKRINELGIEQVIEEAAYTWFNRIVAIRYMEINDYLPLTKDNQSLGIRVLSSKDNTPDPEILKFTNLTNPDLDIDFKKEKYVELKNDNEKFKYVLLLVCKKLGRVIPQVFDGITDYIDILIPDNLLNDTGFITKVINDVPENNYNQVEIIGWLYQYYNQTEKDKLISSNQAYKKNEIPYVTQLFTPDWIVKYMVENSLGRYWIEQGGSEKLVENWRYFINDNLEKNNAKKKITELKCIDLCSGSGHILVYMFEILYQIYLSEGYNKNDISRLILENNLYGLDIDDRAGQLSILSVILKAREYDKNIFKSKIITNLNIMSIQESNSINYSIIDNIKTEQNREYTKYLIDNFQNAKEIGSLLILENNNYSDLIEEIENDNTIFGIELREKILPIIKSANLLTNKYDVVVTNPPYMNFSSFSSNLKTYVTKQYNDSKEDLCSAFMEGSHLNENGLLAMVNQQSWMFLASFENLRKKIVNNKTIINMIHLGTKAFEGVRGAVTTSFVISNKYKKDYKGMYYRLVELENEKDKEKALLSKNSEYIYYADNNRFINTPSYKISYWIKEQYLNNFKNKSVGDYADTKKGIMTGNDELFVRLWYEVDKNNIGFKCQSSDDINDSGLRWFPITSGGARRKWYGNFISIVNLYDNAYRITHKKNNNYRLRDTQYYCREAGTWSEIGGNNFSVRYVPKGITFGNGGPCLFSNEYLKYIIAFLNTNVSKEYFYLIAPTVNFGPHQIKQVPMIIDSKYLKKILDLCDMNINVSKSDWDSFETSWDFITHPLIEYKTGSGYDKDIDKWDYKIKDAYESWKFNCDEKFKLLKNNEEELNRIFIDIYGLQDELTPDVEDKDITIRKADREREIKSLISYAVGCMLGRYSLDEDGLVYACGTFDKNKYKTYSVDEDNIIPITDEAYFGDDIVERFKKFIKVVYGDNTFNENMDFIAETLGKKGTETSEDTIRRYFLNDFFDDHIKIYKKRPIYWLFDSGKKKGFKALIYMHRFNENLIPKLRLDYLHRVQTTYEKLLSDVNYKLTTDLSLSDKKAAQNRQADLNAKLNEIKEYDEKIAHIANQRINIDLDDGVKVNYDKFKDILAKIK